MKRISHTSLPEPDRSVFRLCMYNADHPAGKHFSYKTEKEMFKAEKDMLKSGKWADTIEGIEKLKEAA